MPLPDRCFCHEDGHREGRRTRGEATRTPGAFRRAPLAGRHCRIAGRAGLSGLPENPRVLSHLEWTCIPAGRPQPEFPRDVVPAQPPQGVLDRASTVLLLLGRSVHADRVRRALPRLF